jgi:hypothetical protein
VTTSLLAPAEDHESWPNMDSAEEDRSDVELLALFEAQGVPRENIMYLQDEAATSAAITRALIDMLAKTKSGDTLFCHFCGHGAWDPETDVASIVPYDAGTAPLVSQRTILKILQGHFLGSQCVLMVLEW